MVFLKYHLKAKLNTLFYKSNRECEILDLSPLGTPRESLKFNDSGFESLKEKWVRDVGKPSHKITSRKSIKY